MQSGGSPKPSTVAEAESLGQAARSFSVFVANCNHGRFLAQALEAILAQSVQPREIRIVDDASSDESRDIIAAFAAAHPHVRTIFHDERRGVIANMQEFLNDVSDEYVFFAASDDMILPGLFEDSLALLLRHPEAGLCSAMIRLMDEDGTDRGFFRSLTPSSRPALIAQAEVARLLLDMDSWFIGNTTIYRRAALAEAGGFDEKLGGFADNYASRAVALCHGACFIPQALACWRRMKTGFAARSSTDPARALAIADHACDRMGHADAAIFPPGYAERWRARWIYGAIGQCLQEAPPDLWERVAALLVPQTVSDRVSITLAQSLGVAGRLLFRLYIALRLRHQDLMIAACANLKGWWLVRLRGHSGSPATRARHH